MAGEEMYSCNAEIAHEENAWQINALNRFGTPRAYKDYDDYSNQRFNPFIDAGAWHGFLLPEQKAQYGAFNGPFVIAEEYGLYFATQLESLTITEQSTGKVFDWSKAESVRFAKPHQLIQRYCFESLAVELRLSFISERTALVTTQLVNLSTKKMALVADWRGALMERWNKVTSADKVKHLNQRHIEVDADGIRIKHGNVRQQWDMLTDENAEYLIKRSVIASNVESVSGSSNYHQRANIPIGAEKSQRIYTAHSYFHNKTEKENELPLIQAALQQPNSYLFATEKRWQSYLLAIEHLKENDRKLALKAINTLLSNWRSPAGAIKHQGVSPSATARWFNGFWAWDSWKHSFALAQIAPDLAKDGIRTMYDYQISAQDPLRPQDAGMVVDAIFYNQDLDRGGEGGNWNERNTKPGLAAWAVWQIYQKTGDIDFVKALFEPLLASHLWWYRNRDHDQNGLVEYGATNHRFHNTKAGELTFKIKAHFSDLPKQVQSKCVDEQTKWLSCYGSTAYQWASSNFLPSDIDIGAQHGAGWESGMDNAARFGFINAEQLTRYANKYYEGNKALAAKDWRVAFFRNLSDDGTLLGFSINQESVDLNSYLAYEKTLLAKMARFFNKVSLAEQLTNEANALSKKINACFYDQDTGYYYDRQIDPEKTSKVNGEICSGKLLVQRGKGPEGWTPLWANIATQEQAKRVISHMQSREAFNSVVPLATAAKDNPAYHPDIYWRGRVWLDQFYFGIKALENYDYDELAQQYTQRLMNNAQSLSSNEAIRENYHPESGKQQGATNFSWSAAHLLMLLLEEE